MTRDPATSAKTEQEPRERSFTPFEKELLNDFQRGFPLVPRPYQAIAEQLRVDESCVIETLGRLKETKAISRVGAVVAPQRTGWSTLAAMAVPEARLEAVAELVSAYPEVNHNYEREHCFNLWFVVTASDRGTVKRVLGEIETATGLTVLDLPLEQAFRLDLGFDLQWT